MKKLIQQISRDLYILKGDSTLYTLRLNVIYFGNPSSAELSALEQQVRTNERKKYLEY
jgi:hypothetical protein